MLHKVIKRDGEFGIFTDSSIEKGTLIFSSLDWVSDEQSGWALLSINDINRLNPKIKEQFLRYSYDKDFNSIIGTFNWSNATHLSNFINHSCNPNSVYDLNDNIIAYRDIREGEEITIDYGTFIVNIDQNFICQCGSERCRQYIKKDDWRFLAFVYQYSFPTFMHREIENLLSPEYNSMWRS